MDEAEFDVVVVGSGAAGMTAALTAAHHGLTALVVEKTDRFGGSTARSGGGIWAPGNTVLNRAGVVDSPELARAYLAYVAGDGVHAARQQALLAHGPAMLDLVRALTPVDFAWVPGYADYYPEAPGGVAAGRSVEPVPLDGRVLGAELPHLNPPYLPTPAGVTITQAEYRWLSLGPRHPRAMLASVKVAGRLVRYRVLRQQMLTMGQALAAGLRAGLRDLAVPVWLNTPMTGLHTEDGRVTGVEVTRDGQAVLIRARRGVLLAAGGFEHNGPMRERYQQPPIGTDWTTGAAGNTGDAIVAGEAAGAALDLMDDAWWGPSIPLARGPYFCLAERSLPGCILVNGAGQRFVNESAPYVDAVHAMYAGHTPEVPHIPSWLITDQRYRDRYVFAGLPPRKSLPRRWYAAGAVFRAPDLAGLAGQIGIDGAALAKTVDQVQRVRRDRPGRGLRPRRLRLRPVLQRPAAAAQPVPGPAPPAAVLRHQDRPRRPGHQGRPAHRRAGPGAARRRLGHPRPVRGGQHQRGRDGAQLRRRGGDDRPGYDVRLPGGAGPGWGELAGTGVRQEMSVLGWGGRCAGGR